jgi:hypothetical protein
MSFNYTLKRTIVKDSEQTFEKILFKNASSTISSEPDPRDDLFKKFTPEDYENRREMFSRIPLLKPPLNRVWIDDNTVEFHHYFDTVDDAKTYYNWRKDNSFDPTDEYSITYTLVDADGNQISLV